MFWGLFCRCVNIYNFYFYTIYIKRSLIIRGLMFSIEMIWMFGSILMAMPTPAWLFVGYPDQWTSKRDDLCESIVFPVGRRTSWNAQKDSFAFATWRIAFSNRQSSLALWTFIVPNFQNWNCEELRGARSEEIAEKKQMRKREKICVVWFMLRRFYTRVLSESRCKYFCSIRLV